MSGIVLLLLGATIVRILLTRVRVSLPDGMRQHQAQANAGKALSGP